MGQISGLFVYARTGRWLTAIGLAMDGTWFDKRHGTAVDAPALTDYAYTLREVQMAVLAAGKTTRTDVVNVAGIVLASEPGKGYDTVQELIRKRCGDKAPALIAAMQAQAELEQAA